VGDILAKGGSADIPAFFAVISGVFGCFASIYSGVLPQRIGWVVISPFAAEYIVRRDHAPLNRLEL
jgi:hypothetical protein